MSQGRINLLALAAGQGTRFSSDSRYEGIHKTMVPVFDAPMSIFSLKNTVELMGELDFKATFLISDSVGLNLEEVDALIYAHIKDLRSIKPEIQVGYVNGPGESSAVVKDLMGTENPILLVNTDQYIVGGFEDGIRDALADETVDGVIFCFESSEPRYSYVEVDENMIATYMVEKQVVGNIASAGICFWKNSGMYYQYLDVARELEPGEVYISSVHSAAIKNGRKFRVVMLDTFIDLGTPADLEVLEDKWKKLSE